MRLLQYIPIVIVTIILNSCNVLNLYEDGQLSDPSDLFMIGKNYESIIQVDDKISLSIWNHDDLSIGSVFSIYNSNEAYGKWILIDNNGFGTFPKIGEVKLIGLTCKQAADTLESIYVKHIVDPKIVVKILNKEVTVLGEVRTPGNYSLDKEVYTLNEVIGKAQGTMKYSNLEEVKIIRDTNMYVVDITDFNSYGNVPIIASDVVVIPSRKRKGLDEKAPTIIPFASAATAVAVLLSLINR